VRCRSRPSASNPPTGRPTSASRSRPSRSASGPVAIVTAPAPSTVYISSRAFSTTARYPRSSASRSARSSAAVPTVASSSASRRCSSLNPPGSTVASVTTPYSPRGTYSADCAGPVRRAPSVVPSMDSPVRNASAAVPSSASYTGRSGSSSSTRSEVAAGRRVWVSGSYSRTVLSATPSRSVTAADTVAATASASGAVTSSRVVSSSPVRVSSRRSRSVTSRPETTMLSTSPSSSTTGWTLASTTRRPSPAP